MTATATATEIRPGVRTFSSCLASHGLALTRDRATTLQINVGLNCNLACRHCHHSAGPGRHEVMGTETMKAVTAYAARVAFDTVDVTGGAPELVPGIAEFIAELARSTKRVLFRTNLVALHDHCDAALVERFAALGVTLFASLPSINAGQADSQRGSGVFETSVAMLRRLNGAGYGVAGSGLELNLVANPSGAFLPAAQQAAERRFRQELARRYGVAFSSLFTFANVPLGRFREWLAASGNLGDYLEKLAAGFNPCTVPGLMCRRQAVIDWRGYLFDCDFNLAAGLPLGGSPIHVSELNGPPPAGIAVPTGDYCYACTAGAGFTCAGAIS
ncbi:cyclic pyranopterin monophosphate synthase [Geobacter sp. OR-1]|uniref:arsenosugar biosynthesis radical SAM (seleno)protein ArsS n=1 Tax=Geobacter sp. OR-1 TaxID=1266765 RepID=UPI0005428DA4|nr:arsenosugar biosynthesis radical SAM (seleno)protein ArsS [Geobacter sp. OR-1]GAM09600.1 cyclic pyranopterin monophosphate synthase [Geobacter sp. OR-1]